MKFVIPFFLNVGNNYLRKEHINSGFLFLNNNKTIEDCIFFLKSISFEATNKLLYEFKYYNSFHENDLTD